MSKMEAVLFDLDGTLVDTYDLILASHRYATRKVLDRVISDERLMSTVGTPLEDQMADYTDDPAVVAELCAVYRDHNARVHDELIKSFDGVTGQLDDLRCAGVRMGIVTSKRADVARKATDLYGITTYMECIVGGADTPQHKPHPAPILKGCEIMSIDPLRSAYVGDSPFDIKAGNAAGCKTLAVTWGMFAEDVLVAEHPAAVAHKVSEMASALLSL